MLTSIRFRLVHFASLQALVEYATSDLHRLEQRSADDQTIMQHMAICTDGATRISFDGWLFSTPEELSEYIADTYGSWTQVHDDHPDIAIVNALCGHSELSCVEHNGIVYSMYHD